MINTTLCYIEKDKVLDLNIWAGDQIFLKKLIEDEEFFTLKVVYEGDTLVESNLKNYGNVCHSVETVI